MRAPAADVNHSVKRWRGLLQDARHWRRVSEGYLRPIAPAPHVPDPSTWRDDDLTIAWLGHSTLLMNFFGAFVGVLMTLAVAVGGLLTSFKAIGRKGPIDVMAVPIGAYNPWIASHCTPEQAVEMADEARARFVIPIHHQTFRLGREPMDEPIRRFQKALEPERVALSEVGETFRLPVQQK